MRIEALQGNVYPHASAAPLTEGEVTFSWLNIRSEDLQDVLEAIKRFYPEGKRYLIQFRADNAESVRFPEQGHILFEPNPDEKSARKYSVDELEVAILDEASDIGLLD